jgi:hypothetical protein
VARATGRIAEAKEHLAAAHRVTDRRGVAESMAQVLIGEGAVHLADGRPLDAMPWLERAGRLATASSPLDVPRVRLLESQALTELRETGPALAAAGEAARLADESGQRLVRVRALNALADLHEVTGGPAARVRAEADALLRQIELPGAGPAQPVG